MTDFPICIAAVARCRFEGRQRVANGIIVYMENVDTRVDAYVEQWRNQSAPIGSISSAPWIEKIESTSTNSARMPTRRRHVCQAGIGRWSTTEFGHERALRVSRQSGGFSWPARPRQCR